MVDGEDGGDDPGRRSPGHPDGPPGAPPQPGGSPPARPPGDLAASPGDHPAHVSLVPRAGHLRQAGPG